MFVFGSVVLTDSLLFRRLGGHLRSTPSSPVTVISGDDNDDDGYDDDGQSCSNKERRNRFLVL